MNPLLLWRPADRPLAVLAVGAHPDDIEIGAGGALLSLADRHRGMEVRYVLLTGSPERQREAREAARAFTPGARLDADFHALPDGRLPAAWDRARQALEATARDFRPDVIFAPSPDDAHQDHRTAGKLITTVFRDSLVLAYEIPEWDGGMRRPNAYFPLTAGTARRKAELIAKCYPSQDGRDGWGEETFLALARLRGLECSAHYAEAFTCPKLALA